MKKIDEGQQFSRLGISVGWKMKSVNGILLNEDNEKKIYDIVNKGEKSTIVFYVIFFYFSKVR